MELYDERQRKRKGKGKGGKPTSSSTSVCWSCGKTGHFAKQLPETTVFQLLKEKNFTRRRTQEIGLSLVRTIGQSGPIGRSTR